MEWTYKEDVSEMTKEEELALYLKNGNFDRFIQAWYQKYYSLGHLGGKIVIDDLKIDEIESLNGFLGGFIKEKRIEISYLQLVKCLNKTRFENVDFLEVLNLIYGKKIESKKEKRNKIQQEKEKFQLKQLQRFAGTKSFQWLKEYFKFDKSFNRYYELDVNKYKETLDYVCQALNHLPMYNQEYESLAVFSQKITKNPHYFDKNLPLDLLMKGIKSLLKIEDDQYDHISEILYKVGIIKDELSNYCYVCHIKPIEACYGWTSFYDQYEPWNLNLHNLGKLQCKLNQEDIYICENPAVFINLCEYIKLQKLNIGLICGNGQINFCTYKLLDLLIESNCHLYYCGDYDSEGLVIADKLKKKYGNYLSLFEYSLNNLNVIKIKQNNISSKRLAMLTSIENEELKTIAKKIYEEKIFGYQEGLIDIYKKRIGEKYI